MQSFGRVMTVVLFASASMFQAKRYMMAPTEIRIAPRTHKPFSALARTTTSRLGVTIAMDDRIARDSAGRRYQEQHLPWTTDPEQPVYLYRVIDARAKELIFFNPARKTATPQPWDQPTDVDLKPSGDQPADGFSGGIYLVHHEYLGKRKINGLTCYGEQTTYTLAANRSSVHRKFEVWYSPDIEADVLLMEHREDPEVYEQKSEVHDVVMGEPAASLFQIPTDFQTIIKKVSP